MRSSLWALAMSCLLIDGVEARPRESGTRGSDLFHPTPADSMRELSTDRPDRTESPYTLDAGHFQFEMDLAAWTRDRSAGRRFDQWGVATTNLKAGLTPRADLQVVIETWTRTRTEIDALRSETRSGFGDVTMRLKLNLVGNDGGPAFGIMPFAALPTAREGLGRAAVEIGVIAPFACDLPHGWGFGAMAEVDMTPAFSRSEIWIASATVAHNVAGPLGGYLELFGARPADRGSDATATFDAGLTCTIGRDVQLDGGINLGLNEATEDYTLFLGWSVRR